MRSNSQSGQSLLVIVLLIAIVFTIIASASYRLTTETQSAKVQEDTVRTLAAADSGIEKGLQQLDSLTVGTPYSFNSAQIGIGLSGIDAAASTITVNTEQDQYFISPNVEKDGQYTFYLYDYPGGSTTYNNQMWLSFGPQVAVSSGCGSGRTIPALEITMIKTDSSISRTVIEPCSTTPSLQYSSGQKNFSATNHTITTANGISQNFGYRANFSAAELNNVKLFIVRSLFTNTVLGFDTNAPAVKFSNQGRTITAEAVSTTGISKVVTLFRSYPQLPADLFVTTF